MTKRLIFQGYSDDTFACEGPGIDVDLDNCGSREPIYMRVDGTGGSLVVRGQYWDGPCKGWTIGIAPADFGDEEHHIPDWSIGVGRSDREYSPMLTIEAPDDVAVYLLDGDGDRLIHRED